MIRNSSLPTKIEAIGGRVVYLHNTINSHFLVMGILGLVVYQLFFGLEFSIGFLFYILLISLFYWLVFKLGDFYWTFLLFGPLFFGLLIFGNDPGPVISLMLINIILFFATQLIFFGLVYVLILKDLTTPLRIAANSVLTLAPTTASFWVSLFFTSLFNLTLIYRPRPVGLKGGLFFFSLVLAGALGRKALPRNRDQVFRNPKPKEGPKIKRVILLNIDGCSLKKFRQAGTPNLDKLKKEGAFFVNGAETVYRGLTNPAFSSILTGTTPEIHGVTDNNLGLKVKTKALPDIVRTIIYGCVHMEQFAKKDWPVRVVSLTRYGFKADEVVLKWLKRDLKQNRARFYVVDLSSVDLAGHGYGSYSRQYSDQIERADRLIGQTIDWLKKKKFFKDSLVIVTSDHGMKMIDHAYLLFEEEKYVPLLMLGAGVKNGKKIKKVPSIMDLAPTISFCLGVDYPEKMKARVLEEVIV